MTIDLTSLSDGDLKRLYNQTEKEISALNNYQMAIKILLNSLYGALGQSGFRFFNSNVAETITLVGQYALRSVERDIDAKLNALFKTVDHKYIIYCDTDSLMFNLQPVIEKFMPGVETTLRIKKMEKLAVDILQREVNTIVSKACDSMNVYENRLSFKLEKCADKAIFIGKKKYTVRVYSSEGVTYATPKYAVTGLELVRSSTPQFIRKKLKELLPLVFNSTEEELQGFLAETKKEFDKLPVDKIAFPRSANDLDKYSSDETIYTKGKSVPIQVRAALLYNSLIRKHGLVGKYSLINSGTKIKFVYLKIPNTLRENVIGFPADETLPIEFGLHRYVDAELQWEKTMIASTQIILNAIDWDTEAKSTLDDFFN